MPKHNNVIPNAHFHKHWQNRVKTWFDQPARKKSRRLARKAKAVAVGPRPVEGLLRPIVRCPTHRYNIKVRTGRGFTPQELKAAKIGKKVARTIGIAVDKRRRNKSTQAMLDNVQRLNTYKTKLVVLPRRNSKKAKAGDASPEEARLATQLTGVVMPIPAPSKAVEFTAVTDEMKARNVFACLRQERCNVRMAGKRAKRAKEEAEKAAAAQ